MAEIIDMPRLSDTMEEGTIIKWHKKVGDVIKAGDLLAEIETDKATMEFEAPIDGMLLHIGAAEGQSLPVGKLLAVIGQPGETFEAVRASDAVPSAQTAPSEAPAQAAIYPEAPAPSRIKASPLAKSLAKQHQIDLETLKGTGPQGRIIKRDIETYLATQAHPTTPTSRETLPPEPSASSEEIPLTSMRKTIARRLVESKNQAPHFYLSVSIVMDKVIALRQELNTHSPVKISFNDIIVKAAALALKKHPYLNGSFSENAIFLHKDIHIGVAVAIEEGLVVPVVRHADRKGIAQIAQEIQTLAQKARDRKLSPQELTGSTFSISNLGMYGIEDFTAIINPPEAAILAVGTIQKSPVVENDTLQIQSLMKVTLSCDHRIVDGATGAQFLQTLKQLLEEPLRLLL
ncbi:MAG: pyruvate dehydrogenase complex dihydrolipoamide acetyltransferase [Bacteroidia bacterium]